MKVSSRLLISAGIILTGLLLTSNIVLKKQYDAIDKSDIYWTYDKVLEQPFKYLNITGGNGTNIFYEPAAKPSVRVLHEWAKYHGGKVKAIVKNDTLFINFDFKPSNEYEKYWMKNAAPIRIFSPQLLSVTGNNTHFEMDNVKQKTLNVHIIGKSSFEMETMLKELDSVNIYQRDSSQVVFELSPEYRTVTVTDPTRIGVSISESVQTNRNESIQINSVKADIAGYSLLDVGHAQVQKIQLHISDSAGVILSGGALRKINTPVSNNE